MSELAMPLRPPAPEGSPVRQAPSRREAYLQRLTWLFTLFNSVRVFSYLPTL